MVDNTRDDQKPLHLAGDLGDMSIGMSNGDNGIHQDEREDNEGLRSLHSQSGFPESTVNGVPSILKPSRTPSSRSPTKTSSLPQSPSVEMKQDATVGGEITITQEPGQAPKLSRSASKKIPARPPQLFSDYKDATSEAKQTFEPITKCIYAKQSLGDTDHAMECDCSEEWHSESKRNLACGEDSDCINRATKMECIGDCGCGPRCQNQRFQLQQYADVSVIKTEKKGFGLRANKDLRAHQFIFEYIGEVIGEAAFHRRMVQYDEEGIKHFYFMSLNKGEFVDATKKGNLGRFCNHSCNPNCYVDKWVVGDKLRMGIFTERKILAGEELVFNYNVDRYGANPQPCYCDEPNCTGHIGGRTQTERGTKLSALTIEALGIEDGDDWDTAVSRKARKKKVGEDDEEYVDSIQPKSLDEDAVTKVMATLNQCKEKWIIVKLLSRIQRCDGERVIARVVRMHGYRILNTTLSTWMEDDNIVLQILDILFRLPRLTRNKIQDSKIEETVEKLRTKDDEKVKEKSTEILKIWSALEVGYRIPRLKRDPAVVAAAEKTEREERRRAARERSKSRSRSPSPEIPKGPSRSQPGPRFFPPRPPFRRPYIPSLPAGWFSAQSNGKMYYYSANGQTTWTRPTTPAIQPPPPPRVVTNEQRLQDIINSITSKPSEEPEKPKDMEMESTTPTEEPKLEKKASKEKDRERDKRKEKEKKKENAKEEKWRSYDEAKRKTIYKNTIFPHVKYVMDKFRRKLSKDDLKKFAKEVSDTIVNSDFKHKRVEDPTKLSDKQVHQLKKFVKAYFDKAVAKKPEHERRHAEKEQAKLAQATPTATPSATALSSQAVSPVATKDTPNLDANDESILSDHDDEEDEPSPSADGTSPDTDLKRKREADETPLTGISPERDQGTPQKKFRPDETPPAPPPPPPPPISESDDAEDVTEESPTCAPNSASNAGSPMMEDQVDGAGDSMRLRSLNSVLDEDEGDYEPHEVPHAIPNVDMQNDAEDYEPEDVSNSASEVRKLDGEPNVDMQNDTEDYEPEDLSDNMSGVEKFNGDPRLALKQNS